MPTEDSEAQQPTSSTSGEPDGQKHPADSSQMTSPVRNIVMELGIDTESGAIGLGYSPDNGVHFYVTDTVKGRKYRQEDGDHIWPYLQSKLWPAIKPEVEKYVGKATDNPSTPTSGAVTWLDIQNKPDLVTETELTQKLTDFKKSLPTPSEADLSSYATKSAVEDNSTAIANMQGQLDGYATKADYQANSTAIGDLKSQLASYAKSLQSSASASGSQVSLSGSSMTIDVDKGTITFKGKMPEPVQAASLAAQRSTVTSSGQTALRSANAALSSAQAALSAASSAYDQLKAMKPASESDVTLVNHDGLFSDVHEGYTEKFTGKIPEGTVKAVLDVTLKMTSYDDLTDSFTLDDTGLTQRFDFKTANGNDQDFSFHFTIEDPQVIQKLTSITISPETLTHWTRGISVIAHCYTGGPDSATLKSETDQASSAMSAESSAAASASTAVSTASSQMSDALAKLDAVKVPQVPYSFNVDKSGLSYTVEDKTASLVKIPPDSVSKHDDQQIDVDHPDDNKKPFDYSDGFSYALKNAASIGIDRKDFTQEAQAGSRGLLTTKAIKGLVKQRFELLDGKEPLTFERTGAGEKWTDWVCITSWN